MAGLEPSLRDKCFLRQTGNWKWTALHSAVNAGNNHAVRVILTHVSPSVRAGLLRKEDDWERNILHIAADRKRYSTLELLLDLLSDGEKNELLMMRDCRHRSPLHIIAYHSCADVATTILSTLNPERRNKLVLAKDGMEHTMLHIAAAREGGGEVVEMLLDLVDEETRERLLLSKNIWRRTAVHVAADANKIDIMNLILEKAPDKVKEFQDGGERAMELTTSVRYQLTVALDHRSKTAYDLAVVEWRKKFDELECWMQANDMLKDLPAETKDKFLLHKRGPHGKTALYVAVDQQRQEVTKCILKAVSKTKRKELLTIVGMWKRTVLHNTLETSSYDMTKMLNDLTDDEEWEHLLFAPDWWERTALHVAAMKGNMDIMRLILESVSGYLRDLLLFSTDIFKRTALHGAKSRDVARILISSCSRHRAQRFIKACDRNGRTAADIAAWWSRRDVLKGIFEHCSKATCKFLFEHEDVDGRGLMHWAAAVMREGALQYLLSYILDTDLPLFEVLRSGKGEESVIHILVVSQKLSILSDILKMLSIEQRKVLLRHTNTQGYSPFHMALVPANDFHGNFHRFIKPLDDVLNLLPPRIVRHVNSEVVNVLHFLINEHPVQLTGTVVFLNRSVLSNQSLLQLRNYQWDSTDLIPKVVTRDIQPLLLYDFELIMTVVLNSADQSTRNIKTFWFLRYLSQRLGVVPPGDAG